MPIDKLTKRLFKTEDESGKQSNLKKKKGKKSQVIGLVIY